MNGTDIELRKELWMWRALIILLVIILSMTTVVTFIRDRDQHAIDNKERARNWQIIEGNQDMLRSMVDKNYETILLVDEHLRQCSGCHSHPVVKR